MRNWPSKRIQAKIAAKNAVIVRAAYSQFIDKAKVARDFLDSHPTVTDDATADRERARTWTKINVRTNSEPMNAALRKVYAEGYVTGDKAARHSIRQAALNKAPTLSTLMPILTDTQATSWARWTPGNEAAAALLNPPGGLRSLLDQRGITIRGIEQTSVDHLGTILADGLRTGQSLQMTADAIETYLQAAMDEEFGDPAKALQIAVTETSRAANLASLERYKESQIDQVEWLGIDPCTEICEQNDGEVRNIGEEFPSGDTEPPAHPNCYCTVLPVIPGENIQLSVMPTKDGVPGPVEVEAALSRLETLPNPLPGSVDEPEKWVESFWKVVPLPTVNPNIWASAKVGLVQMSDLVGTDASLKKKILREHIESMGQATTPYRNFPLVGRKKDQLIILDGHHRLGAMWLLGMESAPVWIANI